MNSHPSQEGGLRPLKNMGSSSYLKITMRGFNKKVLFAFSLFTFLRLFVATSINLYSLPIEGKISLLYPTTLFVIFFGVGLLNSLLIWKLCKVWFNGKVGFLGALIYIISPWTIYLELSYSIYILILTGLLIVISILQSERSLIPLKVYTFVSLVGMSVLIVFLAKPYMFTDLGVTNTVNTYRGEVEGSLSFIAKLVENRYIFFVVRFITNFFNHLSPLIYFTPESRLLNFSLSSPILFGFIFPFILGLKIFFQKLVRWELIVLFAIISLPSVLSRPSPDLNRLILVSPIIFIITALGLHSLISKKNLTSKAILMLTCLLIIIQMGVFVLDVSFREPIRFVSK